MESARTPEEQLHIDVGQLVLFGINFSIEQGTQLRRKTDQPQQFEKIGHRTVPIDPAERATEETKMKGAGIKL